MVWKGKNRYSQFGLGQLRAITPEQNYLLTVSFS